MICLYTFIGFLDFWSSIDAAFGCTPCLKICSFCMVCMPGGRAGSSEAQPISCHIDEALLVGLVLRIPDDAVDVVELVSRTQFEILEADALDKVIPLFVLLLVPPLLLFGTLTNCAVARFPSAVFT